MPTCRIVAPALLLLALAPAAAPAADSPTQYKRMPWHLVDLWWDLGRDHSFQSYSIDVEISHQPPADVNLYIAPIGLGRLSRTPFYGGIQTQADGYTKRDRRLRKLGPGFLMSMWGQRSHDAIRPSAGGYCQSSGHEGDFVSVRRPFAWKQGKFTYRIVRMDEEVVDGKPFTWVGAFVYVHATDENIFIGALRFPGRDLVLSGKIAGFVEIYGRAIPVEKIPKLTITFGNLRVNGEPAEVKGATAIYPKGVPDYAAAAAAGMSVVVRVGEPVPDRARRSEKLLPAKE